MAFVCLTKGLLHLNQITSAYISHLCLKTSKTIQFNDHDRWKVIFLQIKDQIIC